MNIKRSGDKKQGGTFKYNSKTEVTPNQMRYLIQIAQCPVGSVLKFQAYLPFVILKTNAGVLLAKWSAHLFN